MKKTLLFFIQGVLMVLSPVQAKEVQSEHNNMNVVVEERPLTPGTRYRHYRNKKEYKIICVGTHTETEEATVCYEAQYDDPIFGKNHVWFRPKSMFLEMVKEGDKEVPRFELVK